MRPRRRIGGCLIAALASLTLAAGCGGSDSAATGGGGGGGSGQGGHNPSSSSGHAGGSGGEGGSASGGGGAAPEGPMKLISRGAPSFASSTDPASMTASANDDNPASAWSSAALPAWIAYDVSAAPAAERQKALVVWYNFEALDYMQTAPQTYMALPIDYTVETNAAAGGGDPPTDGWTQATQVAGNARSSRHHAIDLDGANWVRVNVTSSSDPAKALLDMDVYSAPSGASNDWLLMGDSITFISTQRAFSDLPALVAKAKAGDDPAIIDAAIGGTNTTTAVDAIDDTLADFPGRFVALAYGTNDHADDYRLESLVKTVIKAGKTPVVPHMPWSDSAGTLGPAINAQIDALYTKYPEILRGPDLWMIFLNRTDLIPPGDIHPNAQGQEVLRAAWADVMAKAYP